MPRIRGAVSSFAALGAALLAACGPQQQGDAVEVADTARPAAQTDSITHHGEWVWITRPDGDSIRAYVAYPERSDTAPAVIVIHEIYGLTEWEPTVADRLAREGYVAIVPDLLSSKHGRSPADPDSGRALMGDLEDERVLADLDATYRWIGEQPAVAEGSIGTIGFCWGGARSFLYGTHNPELDAVVVAYGSAPDSAQLAGIRAPVLGVYGEDDARINADLPRVEQQMQALGKSFEHDIYPGTGHGFLKPGRQGSDGPQVERAWQRVLAFYEEHL